MSSDISLTGEDWHGTQMKPDMFEPVTAEWAGRVSKNAGWLFARQQQTIFCDGLDRQFHYDVPYNQSFYFERVQTRMFWLNEVFGTAVVQYNLVFGDDVDLVVVQATLFMGFGNQWQAVGTSDGTYTGGGWKSLTMLLDPDWHKDQNYLVRNKEYGRLIIRCALEESTVDEELVFQNLSLTMFPRT